MDDSQQFENFKSAQDACRTDLMQLPGVNGSGIRRDANGKFCLVVSHSPDAPQSSLDRAKELFQDIPMSLEANQPDQNM